MSSTARAARPSPVADALRRPQVALPIGLALYFLLHVLIRMSLSDSLELDEAQAVFHSQRPGLGYGSQPPLYNWLQWLFIAAFGLNLFALAFLKNLLLLATYLCTWFLARPLIGLNAATAAAMSLILFPQIGWESQRDLTHSVLVMCLASATLWCYFALLRRPTRVRFAMLGALLGLGVLAKYNFVIFAAGLTAASLLVEEHRSTVWNRRILLTVAVALVVVLPHGLWLLSNLETASAGTLQKMAEGTNVDGYLRNVARGTGSLVGATLAFVWMVALVYALASRRWWKRLALERQTPQARFFVWLYLSWFALLILIVLTGEVGKIKGRWLQPLLFSLPVAVLVVLPALCERPFLVRVGKTCIAMALAILLLIPLRVLLGPTLGKHVRQHDPYPELATELVRRFPQVQTVVTEGTLLAGNLHFQRPAWRTTLWKDLRTGEEAPATEFLLVMPDREGEDWNARLHAALPQAQLGQQGRLTLRYRFGSRETASWRYALISLGNR